jgi:tetratricopeptide (TPR) repeat protein
VKKLQWIAAGVALILVVGVYAATVNQIFGNNVKKQNAQPVTQAAVLSSDSILFHAKESLSPEQASRISLLEKSITRGDVNNQKLHLYHQLARFWKDSVRVFEPYAWYTAEAARLENSENSLTFAAHLFLENLSTEENPSLKQWKALQSKDLFERSLKINPANDSSQVGLGIVDLYGGLASPMEGIQKIRKVADEHPDNIYAQMTLGHASMMSGQFDKAIERFEIVLRAEPNNLEAILSLADASERSGDREKAISWYNKSLPLINIPDLKEEVKRRVAELEKK